MDDTREAALASRAVDEMTDAMTKLDQEIDAAAKEIASKQEERKNTNTELEEADKLRGEEQGEFRTSQQEDQEAAKTVDNAKNVLANFYKDNGLVFLQAPAVEAGEAPPPPPATFEGDEDDAQGRFDKFKADSEAEMKTLTKQIDALKGLKGKKQTEHGQTKDQRRTKKGELDAVLTKMADIAPNCEYFAVNYKLRASNRAVELDGLIKAKAILQGGSFSKAPDPNREMKPGDAFLQRRL